MDKRMDATKGFHATLTPSSKKKCLTPSTANAASPAGGHHAGMAHGRS
jgi:hypothetical protein